MSIASESIESFTASDGASLRFGISRHRDSTSAVVMLHGMASNMTRWSEFVANTSLTEQFTVIRLDLRGHAGSVYRGRIDLERWCHDIAEYLQAQNISQVVLVGHCLGANLATHFCAHYREMTKGVVLIEPIVRQALVGVLARAAKWRPALAALIAMVRALNALGLYRRTLAPLDLAQLDEQTRQIMAEHHGEFLKERYGSVRQDLRQVPTAVYLQDLLAVTAQMPEQGLGNTPALAMLASQSTFTDRDKTLAWLAEQQNCLIESVQAIHWIPTEQPQQMRELIENWCTGLNQPARVQEAHPHQLDQQ